jgi:hypothetical protein
MKSSKKENGQDMEILLNGGKNEIQNSIIPVQWLFSDEVINENPTHLLFIEQTEDEADPKRDFTPSTTKSDVMGNRFLCKIEKGMEYLEIFSPGRHKLTVLALSLRSEKVLSLVFKRKSLRLYEHPLHQPSFKKGGDLYLGTDVYSVMILAKTEMEFEVPQELFIQRPKTGFKKWLWEYIDSHFDFKSRNPCQYKKRLILGFIPFILFSLVKFVIKDLVCGTVIFILKLLRVVWGLIWGFVFLFWGYRPIPVLENIKYCFKGKSSEHTRFFKTKNLLKYRGDNYRLWNKEKSSYMPATPLEFCVIVGIPLLFINQSSEIFKMNKAGASYNSIDISFIIMMVIFGIWSFLGISLDLLRRMRILKPQKSNVAQTETEREKRLKKQPKEADLYLKWLTKNLALKEGKVSGGVDLKNLPAPFSRKERLIQIFKIPYWLIKAKICPPYSD